MPNLDGTGPQGKGPRTGRGMGDCPPNAQNNAGQGNRPQRRGRAQKPRRGQGRN